MVSVDVFLEYVDQIADEKPAYKLGHDGTGGKCDCIGLPLLEEDAWEQSTPGVGSVLITTKMVQVLREMQRVVDTMRMENQ